MGKHSKKSRYTDVARITAEVCGVTPSYVRKIVRGVRKNERILNTYIRILESKNRLIEEIKKQVPL